MCVENVGGKFFWGRHLGEMAGSGATSGKWREVVPPRGNFRKWRHLGEISGSGATSGKWWEVTGELDGNKIV